MNKGYYEDWNNLKHGTKLWMGPPTLIREEVRNPSFTSFASLADGGLVLGGQRSLYMPDIKGVALKAREAVHSTDLIRDRIALVTFESTRMAEVRRRARAGSLRPVSTDCVLWVRCAATRPFFHGRSDRDSWRSA